MSLNHDGHEVIDGELVDAPRVLADRPATAVVLRCDTHPAWQRCELALPKCVPYQTPPEPPDTRTWPERLTTFRVVDRRRLSYPKEPPR